jgi:hypothetical protein
MRDYVDTGITTPPGEECAQIGSREYDYRTRARKETRAYIGLLRRVLGEEPPGAYLSVKAHPHDFGTYLTVVCYYDTADPIAEDYAFRCELNGPETWDEIALRELSSEYKPERR